MEAFRDAALAELEAIREEAMSRFSLKAAEVAHRTGSLSVGESIVAIVCSAAHREEAFSGCRYILEELKRRAPLWKKEISGEGGRWVEGAWALRRISWWSTALPLRARRRAWQGPWWRSIWLPA